MHRKLVVSLIASVVVAFGLLGTNLLLGWKPALGLDLRGGISVTLRPVPGQEYDTASLDLAVERIRERVDSFGVGEPEIVRQDEAIVVNLPGVNDQQQALDLVNVTGKVYLRPVLACGGAPSEADGTPITSPTTVPESTTSSSTTGDGTTTSNVENGTGDSGTVDTSTVDTSTGSSGEPGPSRRVSTAPRTDAPATDAPPTDDTTDTTDTTAGTDDSTTTTVASDVTSTTLVPTETTEPVPFSDPTQQQILYTRPGPDREICQVGPSGGTGEVFVKDSAQARIVGNDWGVTVELKGGGSGEDVWNALAAQCFNRSESCPTGRLAIELDGQIQSAPSVNAPSFQGDVEISGDFSEGQASKLAQVLNSGALPITLQNEAIENVSATLGEDSLDAALVAGSIGVFLVLLFMVVYYGRLAIVVVAGLLISGALIYSATSMISQFYNGVLSLSGIAGLIVSIGVTVDTYVVFFERLKDDVRLGRSLRNSARRGFKSAFRTVLIANTVSLIGALVLFYLSVGAVRGFAFYLALSTVMDIIVAYFFTGPAVLLLARTRFMSGSKVLGIESEPTGTHLSGATS